MVSKLTQLRPTANSLYFPEQGANRSPETVPTGKKLRAQITLVSTILDAHCEYDSVQSSIDASVSKLDECKGTFVFAIHKNITLAR